MPVATNQNVKVQVGGRVFGDFKHQNVKVQFDWPKKPRLGEMERFQLHFCILNAVLELLSENNMHFYILFTQMVPQQADSMIY
ncbi:hypothetical protein [Paenibacillus sp. NPDC058174]|uniref:hypothetical protein n=1 Tax=Paenibacillus sp. NPDC058174 TaxID=3346366 RepID=UPI0036D84DFF